MNAGTPPLLQRLAGKSLLSNQALATSALDNLPLLLFPSLFVEAYTGGHREPPEPETLKAVLGGLDLLLAKRQRPRRWKLQALDLQGEHPGIWTLGYPAMAQMSYPEVPPVKPRASPWTGVAEEQPLVITIHLTIDDGARDDLQAFLLQWALERKERVRLCSRELQILCDSSCEIQKVLSVVSLDSIQELLVSELWHGETMQTFAPYLSQMKNLRILTFCNMRGDFYTPSSPDSSYSSQLGHIWGSCSVSRSCICETSSTLLQHLRLRNLSMDSFSPDPLRALLEQPPGVIARSGQLSRAIYSPPLESYGSPGNIDPDSFTQVLASLAQALEDVRTTQKVQICTDFCRYCDSFQYYSLGPDGSWVFTEEGLHGLG
ncbi:PRAME family member 15-like [Perognathus longimembris pacificus]|uniref:PRAME family member 15-like n=1 Tax=Perognathus longimembris pacificus TaxID=214514 RepID=UPI00201968A2|nr:PRAME family member 15-like [Perognathus longimembris pacificus]